MSVLKGSIDYWLRCVVGAFQPQKTDHKRRDKRVKIAEALRDAFEVYATAENDFAFANFALGDISNTLEVWKGIETHYRQLIERPHHAQPVGPLITFVRYFGSNRNDLVMWQLWVRDPAPGKIHRREMPFVMDGPVHSSVDWPSAEDEANGNSVQSEENAAPPVVAPSTAGVVDSSQAETSPGAPAQTQTEPPPTAEPTPAAAAASSGERVSAQAQHATPNGERIRARPSQASPEWVHPELKASLEKIEKRQENRADWSFRSVRSPLIVIRADWLQTTLWPAFMFAMIFYGVPFGVGVIREQGAASLGRWVRAVFDALAFPIVTM